MRTVSDTFGSWSSLRTSLQQRSQALAVRRGRAKNDVYEMQIRDRFLVRVFHGEPDAWIVKGGTSMLARSILARSTSDVDLVAAYELAESTRRLIELVDVDLGDHLRFEHRKTEPSRAEGHGRQVATMHFAAVAGASVVGRVKVDLVVGLTPVPSAEVIEPDLRVRVPGLLTVPYRAYPAVHSVADKVAATVATYSNGESTRERDLVDLVIYAVTDEFDALELAGAIKAELIRRRLPLVETFVAPRSMAPNYAHRARESAHCAGHPSFADANALMQRFITPLLDGSRTSGTWTDGSWRP